METIRVHAKFHTAHRQLNFPTHCRFVHGHTWRGTIVVSTEEFPRDHIEVSLDFGDLKRILRKFDHKVIVTANDEVFTNPELFEPEGVIVIQGKGPSVEAVANHAWSEVVKLIESRYSGMGKTYRISVEIQETENNFFSVERSAVI